MSKLAKAFWWFFGFLVVFVLLTTVLPSMLWLTKWANETSALQSLQAMDKAEQQYRQDHPDRGFTCRLSELGSDPGRLNQEEIGYKSGYIFTLSDCRTVTADRKTKVVGYTLYAVPQALNRTGNKGFCSDERGKVMVDPKGGTDCTEPR